jgi:cation diffusion facilitator family transporter
MIVVLITAIMMVVEIIAGLLFGSMALLADGLHMASHACALGIAALAYVYARRHAHDPRFSFGTGKLNPLAGFASAVLLLVFALIMVWESVARLIHPVQVFFDHALVVAVLGLVVNGVCVPILRGGTDDHTHAHAHGHGHHDHNLRAAYLHVLADALTSLFAILALLGGKYLGAAWLDPTMGLVGAALVSRWSWGLMRTSGSVLLDRQAPGHVREAITKALEHAGRAHIVDLHVWALGPSGYAAEIALVSDEPETADHYKSLLPKELGLVHVTVEVHQGKVPVAAERQ